MKITSPECGNPPNSTCLGVSAPIDKPRFEHLHDLIAPSPFPSLAGVAQCGRVLPYASFSLFDLLCVKIPLVRRLSGRYRRSKRAVSLIRKTTEDLIKKCREIVDREGADGFNEEFIDESDPSILRFLIASREEVSEKQLRDDLLSMLVAGHETTGSALTWTLFLLAENPDKMRKAQVGS